MYQKKVVVPRADWVVVIPACVVHVLPVLNYRKGYGADKQQPEVRNEAGDDRFQNQTTRSHQKNRAFGQADSMEATGQRPEKPNHVEVLTRQGRGMDGKV
eukprot:gnl/TRDRNA2_/TRDRNA2_96573_c0_seq1.p2 gnl/TRDRNA2_/TRDRNA2_96573_c0~~gnl/TRDRNA2_/TRDRNA2_96573_c0_seq1.p2  ORF type:complete len:100 (+),score=13.76 gnl/TRDRNA2_/TRDRNA2_96573_c0_seq1:82-381(+)